MERIAVLYTVPQLRIGGAERQLLELVRGLDKRRYRPIVAPLYRGGDLHDEFTQIPGAHVSCELLSEGKYDVTVVWHTVRFLCRHGVRIIQPFLVPATVFGLVAGRLAGTRGIVLTERSGARLTSNTYLRLQDKLAGLASVVVANSEAGRASLVQRGVNHRRVTVIENGVNCEWLKPDPAAVCAYRQRLLGPGGTHLVGIAASLTPIKEHETFIHAAAELTRENPDVRFVVLGDGVRRDELVQMAAGLGLTDCMVFFGNTNDVADVIAALDVLVSTSRVEGHSNSILEAMAQGIPVVATDIPGTREIVLDGVTGRLAPVGDWHAFARQIGCALSETDSTQQMACAAREMIETRFGLQQMVARYESLYDSLLARR